MLILASASPRRREILARLGVRFEVVVTEVEELTEGEPHAIVLENAHRKARAGLELAGSPGGAVAIGVDTDVAIDGRLLGKAIDEAAARERLELLSGRTHEVLSGVAVLGSAIALRLFLFIVPVFYCILKPRVTHRTSSDPDLEISHIG